MKNVREFKLIECGGTPYEIGLQWGEGKIRPFDIRVAEFFYLHKDLLII